MVRRVKFDRGDIVRVSLNPTERREQQGDLRPALVLSPAAFNALGVALVTPITQAGNFAGGDMVPQV
jgi:mRNA interferase ChpB